ncbi:MAG: L-arabinose transport system permease protein AraQ [Elusimicrobia bacterium]|nr:L-arabinose transport system permease protein AraQ [Elusimicrobiota bacterium]
MEAEILYPVRKWFTVERISLRLWRVVKSTIKHTILISVAISCIFPLVWMFSSALKTNATVFTDMSLIPSDPQFINFAEAWTKGKFGVYFFNSVLYTLVCVFGVLFIASLAAFAFARFQFPGKNALYYLFLITLMIPVPGAIVALYVLLIHLGLIDTRLGYMLPQINGGLALGLFILRPFFERIPKDLEDAARIDGCGRWGIYWHVAIPLAKPALAVVALFTSLAVWNEFMLAQLVLQSQSLMPLQLGLVKFWGGTLTEYPLLMAGMAISVIPIVIAYIFLQKHIIAGVTAGALKG